MIDIIFQTYGWYSITVLILCFLLFVSGMILGLFLHVLLAAPVTHFYRNRVNLRPVCWKILLFLLTVAYPATFFLCIPEDVFMATFVGIFTYSLMQKMLLWYAAVMIYFLKKSQQPYTIGRLRYKWIVLLHMVFHMAFALAISFADLNEVQLIISIIFADATDLLLVAGGVWVLINQYRMRAKNEQPEDLLLPSAENTPPQG